MSERPPISNPELSSRHQCEGPSGCLPCRPPASLLALKEVGSGPAWSPPPPEAGTQLGTLPWSKYQAATVPGCELAFGGCPAAS